MSDFVFPETEGLFGKSLEKHPYFTKREMDIDNFLFKFKTGPNPAYNTRAERRTVENFTLGLNGMLRISLSWHCHTTALGIGKYLKQSILRCALG